MANIPTRHFTAGFYIQTVLLCPSETAVTTTSIHFGAVANIIANGSKHAINTSNIYRHYRQGSKHAMNAFLPVEHDHVHGPISTGPPIHNSQP